MSRTINEKGRNTRDPKDKTPFLFTEDTEEKTTPAAGPSGSKTRRPPLPETMLGPSVYTTDNTPTGRRGEQQEKKRSPLWNNNIRGLGAEVDRTRNLPGVPWVCFLCLGSPVERLNSRLRSPLVKCARAPTLARRPTRTRKIELERRNARVLGNQSRPSPNAVSAYCSRTGTSVLTTW